MNRTLFAAAAAAFATLATLGSSHAATAAVETADLNLATTEGQAKLQSRIDRAVRSVCSEVVVGSRIAQADKSCMAQARASIEKQVTARRTTSRNGG